jgi:hypothetical protein
MIRMRMREQDRVERGQVGQRNAWLTDSWEEAPKSVIEIWVGEEPSLTDFYQKRRVADVCDPHRPISLAGLTPAAVPGNKVLRPHGCWRRYALTGVLSSFVRYEPLLWNRGEILNGIVEVEPRREIEEENGHHDW